MDATQGVRQKKRILIVDDSEDMRYLLGQLLEEENYEAIFAENGQVALEQAQEHHPDLILMDMSLPVLNGWEAVKQLRQMQDFQKTPILAVTAHASKAEGERAQTIGCNGHIAKPFDIEQMLVSIAQYLPS